MKLWPFGKKKEEPQQPEFNPVIEQDGKVFTHYADFDTRKGDLVVKTEDGVTHITERETAKGVTIDFNEAVPGPAKAAVLEGEQYSTLIGVYTRATQEELDELGLTEAATLVLLEPVAEPEESEPEAVVKDFPGHADFDAPAPGQD